MQVVVARAEPEAGRTAARLAAAGHDPFVAPLFAIAEHPALDVAALGETPAALLATSARALRALAPACVAALRNLPFLAVGERTAEAARMAGFAAVRPGPGSARELADMAVATLPAGARVLYLAGAVRKPDLERALAAAGLIVDLRETYDIVARPALPEALAELLRSGRPARMLHYSRRGAETALALAEAAGLRQPFLALAHHVISPDVAGPLQRAGAATVIVAAHPHEDALLATLPPRS